MSDIYEDPEVLRSPSSARHDDESPSSEDDFDEADDAYFAHDINSPPTWQSPQPIHLAKHRGREDSEDSENWEIYRHVSILDDAASSDENPIIRLLQIQPDVPGNPIHCKILRRPLWDAGKYYALSYSWGTGLRSSEIYILSQGVIEHPLFVSSHLWAALNRMREGECVVNVWVDTVCIDQQNDVEKCAQIQLMAQIFNLAKEVRVWLGEGESLQQAAISDSMLFLSLCEQQCPWWTRLWIVQECAYAEKSPVIMIGPALVSFEDLIERWEAAVQMEHESGNTSHFEKLQSNLELFRTPFQIWKMQNDESRHRLPLLQRLRETAGRECTEPHDRIYALLSLIDKHEERQLRPDYRQSFPELLLEVSRILRESPLWEEKRDANIFGIFLVQPFVLAILSRQYTSQDYGYALTIAARGGYLKLVEAALSEHGDSAHRGHDIGRALHESSGEGHDKVVQVLLDAGADVNFMEGPGSALYRASCKGHEKVVEILVDSGADVNAQELLSNTALQMASRWGNTKIVKILVDAGADVEAVGMHGVTALYAASMGGHEKVVQTLVDAGADVEAVGVQGFTALHVASRWGHEKVVKILVDAGARRMRY